MALAAPSAEAGVRVAVGVGVPFFAPPVVVAPAPVIVAPAYAPAYVAPPVVYGAPAGVVVGGFWGFDRFGHRTWYRHR